ncbi:MAG: tetratricopeptide repeat protein [Candidatus Melainabacteria bacterium]|nr:tetratricopeptide repeat protein [Candidatus Melainabacteria bacterium]
MSQLTFPAALNDRLSEADSQFREGHFVLADELYTKLLADIEELEDFENADIGSLVLKIAESRYAAGAYDKAKLAYEQLLTLQDKKHDTSSKDRIFTLVKVARNYEKCDDQTHAQTRYEQAYELAKTVLPVKHFLRRTVFECYAQWLRTQKSNPLVLSILESELGTSPTPVARESEPAPVEPEKKSSEKREPRKGEDDFARLKSKLGQKKQPDKQPAKPSEDDDSSDDGTEQKASKLAQSKIEKSIDRQVAARKFLHISLGPKEEKVNKSRLKSALVEDFTESTERRKKTDATQTAASVQQGATAQHDSNATVQQEAIIQRDADGEGDEVGQDLLAEAEELLKNLEIAEQTKSASPLLSPGATVDSPGMALKGAPATSEDETAAGLSEFDFYQTFGTSSATAIDLEMERLLAESARLLFNIESLNGPGESQSVDSEESDETEEKRSNSGLLLKGTSGVAMRRSERSYFGQEEENHELRLLQGTLKNCVWLRPSKEGLTTSDGQIFYSATAPETKVREVMNTLKTNALSYFSASGTYPNPEAVQPDRYVNPVTQRYDPVNTCSMIVGKERPKDAETRLDLDLENGQMFNNEPPAKPGAVSVFCVQLGDPNHLPGTPSAPGVPEVLTTQSMYIHGFDRNGDLLRTGADQKILLIELKPNGQKNLSSGDETGKYQTSDICFSEGEPPSQPAIAFKYGLIALLIFAVVGFFIWLQQAAPKEQAE